MYFLALGFPHNLSKLHLQALFYAFGSTLQAKALGRLQPAGKLLLPEQTGQRPPAPGFMTRGWSRMEMRQRSEITAGLGGHGLGKGLLGKMEATTGFYAAEGQDPSRDLEERLSWGKGGRQTS